MTITLEKIRNKARIEWLRQRAAELREGGDLDEIRVALQMENEADDIEWFA